MNAMDSNMIYESSWPLFVLFLNATPSSNFVNEIENKKKINQIPKDQILEWKINKVYGSIGIQ